MSVIDSEDGEGERERSNSDHNSSERNAEASFSVFLKSIRRSECVGEKLEKVRDEIREGRD